jgi:hypothetical protein
MHEKSDSVHPHELQPPPELVDHEAEAPGLPAVVAQCDLLEMRLYIAEEGQAQNAVVAVEAQIALRQRELADLRRDYEKAQNLRAATGKRLADAYKIGPGDTYNQLTGAIKRANTGCGQR